MNEQEAMEIIAKSGNWEQGTAGGKPITRISVDNFTVQYRLKLFNALHTMGIEPGTHLSETLGNTFRLTGQDAINKLKGIQYHVAMTHQTNNQQNQQQPPPNQPVTSAENIERVDDAIEEVKKNAEYISRVKQLEKPTMMVGERERKIGYYRAEAAEGYVALIKSFQVLDNEISPEANKALDGATQKLTQAKIEYENFGGDYSSSKQQKEFVNHKLTELHKTGDIIMISGHETHANIVRIRQLPDGGYSYTRYDSGHETRVVDEQDGKYVVNAVEERRIKNPRDLQELLEAETSKRSLNKGSKEYKAVSDKIDNLTEIPPIRAERDWAQRRGNCTTRGQRIFIDDMLEASGASDYKKVSNSLRSFVTNDHLDPKELISRLKAKKQALLNAGANKPVPDGVHVAETFSDGSVGLTGDSKSLDELNKKLRETGITSYIGTDKSSGIQYLVIPKEHMEAFTEFNGGKLPKAPSMLGKIGKWFGIAGGVMVGAVIAGTAKADEGGSFSDVANAAGKGAVDAAVAPVTNFNNAKTPLDKAVVVAQTIDPTGISNIARTEDKQTQFDKADAIMAQLPMDQEALKMLATNREISPVVARLAEAKYHLQNDDKNLYYKTREKVVETKIASMSEQEYQENLSTAKIEGAKSNAFAQAKQKTCPTLECTNADDSHKAPMQVASKTPQIAKSASM